MAEDTHPPIDMRQLYGTTELSLRQRFENVSKSTRFHQDYCLNANITCVMKSGSNKYNCGDKSCKWEVCVRRRVDGAMYVSMLNDNHYEFRTSIAKLNNNKFAHYQNFKLQYVVTGIRIARPWFHLFKFVITQTWKRTDRSCIEQKMKSST